MFEPYFLGTITNFALQNAGDSKSFLVHNKFCSSKQIVKIHKLYKEYMEKGYDEESKLHFEGANIFFRCFLKEEVIGMTFCPFSQDEDIWKYVTGVIDSSSILKGKSEDIELQIISESETFLGDLKTLLSSFNPAKGKIREDKFCELSVSFTNVINLFGKLIDSSKQSEFNLLLHGKTDLPKCFVIRKDPAALIPFKRSLSDIGFGLHIIHKKKFLNENTILFDTGIALRIPHKYYVEITPLPILAKFGYIMTDGINIINRSYRGNILICLTKISKYSVPLDKKLPLLCCQIIFKRQNYVEIWESSETFEQDSFVTFHPFEQLDETQI